MRFGVNQTKKQPKEKTKTQDEIDRRFGVNQTKKQPKKNKNKKNRMR